MKRDAQIHIAVTAGKRPEKKANFPEDLFKLLNLCWEQEAKERPTITLVSKAMLSLNDVF